MPKLFADYSAIQVPESGTRPLFVDDSPVFDFNVGEFITNPSGDFTLVKGVDAVSEWIRKTLVTARMVWSIYPNWYGCDVLHEIGNQRPDFVGAASSLSVLGLMEKEIKDALLVDQRIIDVGNFRTRLEEDRAFMTFDVLTVLGTITNLNFVAEI